MPWLENASSSLSRLGPAPSTPRFVVFSIAVLLAAWLVAAFEFVPILDHVNLAFHEAGHPIFGLFGELMHWLGGTIAQFVFPLASTWHFLRRQQLLSAAACALWAAENLRYVALYLGDARTQYLPLVGGGEHDWTYLLSRFGLLQQDTAIASALVVLSWSGWLLVWALVAARWWLARQEQQRAAAVAERERIIEQARRSRPSPAAKKDQQGQSLD